MALPPVIRWSSAEGCYQALCCVCHGWDNLLSEGYVKSLPHDYTHYCGKDMRCCP
jgi:hypothetical protein